MPEAVPIDPEKLLEAAQDFAEHTGGAGRPRPIWLRLAISSSYYALFHHLCLSAVAVLLSESPRHHQLRVVRSFGHGQLRNVCEEVAGRRGRREHLRALSKELGETAIADVAASFCDLQAARHRADYDHLEPVSKAAAVASIGDARKAMRTLDRAPAADRQAFFSLVAIGVRV